MANKQQMMFYNINNQENTNQINNEKLLHMFRKAKHFKPSKFIFFVCFWMKSNGNSHALMTE